MSAGGEQASTCQKEEISLSHLVGKRAIDEDDDYDDDDFSWPC